MLHYLHAKNQENTWSGLREKLVTNNQLITKHGSNSVGPLKTKVWGFNREEIQLEKGREKVMNCQCKCYSWIFPLFLMNFFPIFLLFVNFNFFHIMSCKTSEIFWRLLSFESTFTQLRVENWKVYDPPFARCHEDFTWFWRDKNGEEISLSLFWEGGKI